MSGHGRWTAAGELRLLLLHVAQARENLWAGSRRIYPAFLGAASLDVKNISFLIL